MRLIRTASICLTLAAGSLAVAAPNSISVRVEQLNKTQTEGARTSQSKGLRVLLGNSTQQEFTGLKVKYFIFARDLKTKDISQIDQGEKAADLKGLTTATVETPEVTTVFSDGHASGGGKQTSSTGSSYYSKSKKIDPAGMKMIGYAVQIFDPANKLIGEAYEPLSTKDLIGKVPLGAPTTAPKKKVYTED